MLAVTGASGLIGNVLVRELLARGAKVRCLTHSARHEGSLLGLPVEKLAVDVRQPTALTRALAGAETVFHLAAMVSVAPARARALYRVNLRGTVNVIQACRENGVRRLVYVSSTAAFPPPVGAAVLDETVVIDPVRVVDGYGRSKARATLRVMEAARQGLNAVVLFPSSVLGPYDFKPTQIGRAIIDFARGRIPAWLDGAYDFVDVRDVVRGILLAAEMGRTGEGYILSGTRLSIREFMLLLEELTGRKAPGFRIPFRLARILAAIAPVWYALSRTEPILTPYSLKVLTAGSRMSSDKARRELGYTTRPIRETLNDTVRWLKDNGKLR